MGEALRQNGIDLYRPGNPIQLAVNGYLTMSEELVAGWVGVSLLQDHRSKPRPTLAQYIAGWPNYATGWPFTRLNTISLSSGNWLIVPTITQDEWAEIQSWSAHSCEGSFVKNPRNSRLTRLMSQSVGAVSIQPSPVPTMAGQIDLPTQNAIKEAIVEYSRLETEAYRRLDGSQLHRRATGTALKRAQDSIAAFLRQGIRSESEFIEDQFFGFRRVNGDRVEVDVVAIFNVHDLDRDGRIIRQDPRASFGQTLLMVREDGQWKIAEVKPWRI
jgi:hypothetical protein